MTDLRDDPSTFQIKIPRAGGLLSGWEWGTVLQENSNSIPSNHVRELTTVCKSPAPGDLKLSSGL